MSAPPEKMNFAAAPFQLADFLINLVLRGLIGGYLLLPYTWRIPLMGWTIRTVIGPLAGYRRRALQNLAMVYPDMPPRDRSDLATAVLDNIGRTVMENYSGRAFKARMARLQPKGHGLEVLYAVLQQGQGAVLVSGHFGNYEAIRACMLAHDLPLAALYRPMSNRYFNAHYIETLAAMGGPIFAKGRQGLGGFMRHLRGGGAVAMLFDLHASDGVSMPFLGKPALTALSCAQMALRYDVPLIPSFATRSANGLDFDIELEAPIQRGSAEEMTLALTQRLEVRVTATPAQWFWIHRRWK